MINFRFKKISIIFFIAAALFLTVRLVAFFSDPIRAFDSEDTTKTISVEDDGLNFEISTKVGTVAALLEEEHIKLSEHDKIIPEDDAQIFSGSKIKIQRAVPIKITADGKTFEAYALSKTVRAALRENGITLSRLDKTTPEADSNVSNNLAIVVTRINVEEIVQKEEVAFKTVINNDAKLGWQEKKVTTPGQSGEKEVRYKITYKNGKEISRVILSSEITVLPEPQIETHGTYMQLGKANGGQGTWYSYQGGLFAASTTIPRGAYAKVTNLQNGKTVVVQINDYGPQGKGRIIDLDRVAFTKIASIGAGVIGVKVEPVLN